MENSKAKGKNKENAEIHELDLSYSDPIDTFFTDIVKIEANIETVSLSFGIKSTDNQSAVISHRAIMTLPHFMRLTDVCNKTAVNIKDQIEKQQKQNK